MLTPRKLVRRLRDLVRGKRLDNDVDDEIRFHIEMQTGLLVKQGLSAGQARAKAQSDFGIGARVTDHVREARGLSAANMIDDATRDVRFAVRSLIRTPAFSVVSILTLALGIGATTAIFSVVNGVLLRGLPYPEANRLVMLRERGQTEGRQTFASVSAPNFTDWKEQARRVEDMTAFRGGEATVLGLSEPIRAQAFSVSHDYFRLLGGVPARGRTFAPDESAVGGEPVAVVSHAFWRDRLGGRENVSDVRLAVWGSVYRIIGIMPERFVPFPEEAEFWVPLEPQNVNMGRNSHNDDTIGRLAAGVSIASAAVELDGIAGRLKELYAENNRAIGADVRSLQEVVVGPVRLYLRTLLLAVAVVLLVACVNLASGNLARGAGRARELAIRTVLGAGKGRLARQLLTENLLLATVGGGLGVLLAVWLVRVMLALNPKALPRESAIAVNGNVLLFALGLTVVTGLLIGLLPAIQVGRADLRAGMMPGGRGNAVGRSGVRRFLVATEVAFAVILLVAAGLLVRSFRSLLSQNAGFDASGVLAINVSLPETRYPTGDRIATFYNHALESLKAIPGVEHASYVNIVPLTWSGFGGGMTIDGRPDIPSRYADYRVVSPEYFETMRVPLISGRLFTAADDSTTEHVTVINATMAKLFFGDDSPLGKRLIVRGMDRHRSTPVTVVGVVGDVRSADLSREPGPQHFVPYAQRPERATFGAMLLRTAVTPASVAAVARTRLRLIDPNVLTSVRTLEEIRERSVGDRRFVMVLIGGFAVLALVLAAIGIYGVLAYSVTRRTREIGVRMALGAVRGRVVSMVLGDSLAPVAIGGVVGIVAALAATRLMKSMLYGVSATDPLTLGMVLIVLLAVATFASLIPAIRAARVDPIVALRQE